MIIYFKKGCPVDSLTAAYLDLKFDFTSNRKGYTLILRGTNEYKSRAKTRNCRLEVEIMTYWCQDEPTSKICTKIHMILCLFITNITYFKNCIHCNF